MQVNIYKKNDMQINDIMIKTLFLINSNICCWYNEKDMLYPTSTIL